VAAKPSLPKSTETDQPSGCSNESLTSAKTTSVAVITRRADFLAANRGKRFVTSSFVLLAFKRSEGHSADQQQVRYGITVTKKIGNAVVRNRMKRRFRALLQAALPSQGIAGVDHIMIGRKEDQERDFVSMQSDLEKGLKFLARKLES